MSRSKLARSSFARLLSLLLVAAMLVSGVKLSTTAYAATQHTWTGSHPPTNLSSPANWVGNVAPVAGDDLFFPGGVRRKSIKNNYPNLTIFNSLNFSGTGYNLKKNSLTLTGGINTSNPTGTNQISLPIHLNGSQTFMSANGGTTLTLNGQLNLGGNLLTVAGAGNTRGNGVISSSGGITKNGSGTLTLAGNNTYTGATSVTAGNLLVNGSQSSSGVNLTGGILGGTGRVGAITAAGGSVRPGTSAPGILNSGNVTLTPTTSFVVDLNGTTPGSGYRQLNVSGAVTLGGSLLDVSANFQSAVGDTFTIINNDGVDPVVGIFTGLPEGATLTLGSLPFTISYQGATGNDVALTRTTSASPAPPTISISDVNVAEGDSGTTQAVFTVSLSVLSSQTVTVDYTTADGTATSADDYVAASGTLAFDPGVATRTIAVPVGGDTLNEVDETFILDVRNSTNASIIDAQGQATILNDDALPSLSVEDVSVTEGNTGSVEAVFSVTLSAPSGQTVTVNYATADGTATDNPGNDYDGGSDALSFAPGETDDEVIVSVNGDTVAEGDEAFFVNLTSPTNSTLGDAQGLGTIVDDDAPAPTPTPTPDPSPTPTPTPDPSPSPTPSPSPSPSPTPANPANTVEFSAANYSVDEAAGSITIMVNRSGDTSGAASVEYATFDSTALERPDYTTSLGTLRFAPGETFKSFLVFVTDDTYMDADEFLTLSLSNPQGVSLGGQSTVNLTVTDNDFAPSQLNPIDDARFFARQHYVDFLNREPDASGLDFWANQIDSCGTDANCVANRRVNVSAAYFLSIEFQQTGYLIYLMQKASYGDMPRYRAFLRDTQEIGRGVVVGLPGWQALLEANKHAFIEEWVNRTAFQGVYGGKSDAEFVDTLFANAGVVDVASRDSMLAGLQAATETRSSILRRMTENQAFSQKELNSAFVLMQYFGYMRRNPDDAPDNNLDGFNFWLGKLNQHNGNFVTAEMVKAFILSIEYRRRFAQ